MPIWPSQWPSNTIACCRSRYPQDSGCNSAAYHLDSAPHPLCSITKVTKPIMQFLRQLKVHLIIYLNDLLLAALDRSQLLTNLSTMLRLFVALGFVINLPKSIVCPTHQMEFLGFVIDTVTMNYSSACLQGRAHTEGSFSSTRIGDNSDKNPACFIGTLVATKPAVPLVPIHFWALQDLKDRAFHQHQTSYQSWVQLPQKAKTTLHWWKTQLPSHLSTSLLKPMLP